MAYVFGPFVLYPSRLQLFEGDKRVQVGGRALDILIALVEHAGQLVSKDELLTAAWPKTFVEETNLRVHIAALRRILNDTSSDPTYIVNVAGRGYRFMAPVTEVDDDPRGTPAAVPANAGNSLPPYPTKLVGRDDAIGAIASSLRNNRLVTVVGAGGIGKTTAALAVAHSQAGLHPDGVHFVDFSTLADRSLVPSAVVSRLGIEVHSDDPLPDLAAAIAGRRMLVVFDSCELVSDSVAQLVESLPTGEDGIQVLATSREPIFCAGEYVYRLPSLECPTEDETPTADEALQYSAIELFADRTRAMRSEFVLTDEDAPVVARICRRLDGIPLAIELAASRVEAFGLAELDSIIGQRLLSLTGGRRTAAPRHRTLGAALDWSFDLLTEEERAVFCRLGIFAGRFALDAAVRVGSEGGLREEAVVAAVANLVSKSLIRAEMTAGTTHYRLADTTRAYVVDKLKAQGAYSAAVRRHAAFLTSDLRAAKSAWPTRPKAEWLEIFRGQVDDIRAALDWAFSPDGDPDVALELAVASELVWMQLSLLEEGRVRAQRALALAETIGSKPRAEMQLLAALGWLLLQARGPIPEVRRAWERLDELAKQLGDAEYQSTANVGLWVYYFNIGEFGKSLDLSNIYRQSSNPGTDLGSALIFDQERGQSLHIVGDHPGARQQLEQVLNQYRDEHQRRDDTRLVHDQRSSGRSFITRCLWLEGRTDQAMASLRANIDDEATRQDPLTFANALVHACPVALGMGEAAETRRLTGMLANLARRHGLVPWQHWARAFDARLLIQLGEVARGVEQLRAVVVELRGLAFEVYVLETLGGLAEGLLGLGQLAEAEALIDECLARSQRTQELWCLPDLLRIKAEIIASGDRPDRVASTEKVLLDSIDIATRQGALWWELRSTTRLAALLARNGRSEHGRQLLAGVLSRMSEGSALGDVLHARALLDDIERSAGPGL